MHACRLNDVIGASVREIHSIEMLGYHIPAKVHIKLFISNWFIIANCLTDKFTLFIRKASWAKFLAEMTVPGFG